MKTQIFAYKGVIGINVTDDTKFVNDISAEGQMGMVILTKDLQMTPDAKTILTNSANYRRAGGSFAPVMLTDHGNGESSIGVMGFGKQVLAVPIEIGRDCDITVISDIEIVDAPVDESFIAFVDEFQIGFTN